MCVLVLVLVCSSSSGHAWTYFWFVCHWEDGVVICEPEYMSHGGQCSETVDCPLLLGCTKVLSMHAVQYTVGTVFARAATTSVFSSC